MARTLLVVGGSSGIGREAVRELAPDFDRVLILGRDASRGRAVAESISTTSDAHAAGIDVSTRAGLAEADDWVRSVTGSVQAVVFSAGVMPHRRVETADGHELNLAVHHLAPFGLTALLLDLIADGSPIVQVNSVGHRWPLAGARRLRLPLDDLDFRRDFEQYEAYSRSKLANLLAVYGWAQVLPRGIVVNALHPGLVRTRIGRDQPLGRVRLYNAIAVHPAIPGARIARLVRAGASLGSGAYWDRDVRQASSSLSYDAELRAGLWWETLRMLEPLLSERDAVPPTPDR
ncbi:NAD(P)-dependent dehydrogenase (short-subunit alcohol dehydrogenase family) [Diaminobutyricimonas aerilata]|uniref:NAD(P)-dependent dehydrogenase (Short-subunit alcohol dehydrogenase family) n=1 Tax=Diaminobutyricimonas aerilata TaxID=1162967 RepID=A0A2M9CHB3_9MICO|nr:SDR family NAD(P)-dependent oxidoreductase [Diaminobutyricimonas aerilata]PJJ71278.1 NAD(P)-dependent dehydrogenase (short-subunit alcohol dehydrogenase family) [Diaminobutyricimonas aerilata]